MTLASTTGEGPAAERPNLRLIARHEQRRVAAIPTVSVLLADPIPAKAFWRRWIRNGRVAVEQTSAEPRKLTAVIIDALCGGVELPILALHFLTRSARSDAPSLPSAASRRTPHDLETLAQAALDGGAPVGTTRAASEICHSAWSDRPSLQLAERIESALTGSNSLPWWRVLEAINPLLPEGFWPAILLRPPVAADGYAWLCETADSVAHLAQTVPQWAVAIALSPGEFDRYAREAPASRVKSLLENGVIRFATDDDTGPRPSAGSQDENPAALNRMKELKVSPRLAEALEKARVLQPREDELARSAAERLLFELLESHPRSEGLFALNGNPGFDFGPRAAEVDLLAPGPRLAVEVDGYFHFTDLTSYRRDRRKDWELQRHGFLILRVLAEDVVTRTGEVLDFILAAIDHCQRHPIGKDAEP